MFRSAVARPSGPMPHEYVEPVPKVPSPLPSSRLTVPLPLLLATRSAKPSLFQSAVSRPKGLLPTDRLRWLPSLLAPWFSSTAIWPISIWVTATSGLPSPLKSALATPPVVAETAVAGPAANVPSPLPTCRNTPSAMPVRPARTTSGLLSPLMSERAAATENCEATSRYA